MVCQSHVRTLTQAFLNFAADNDGHLPGSLMSYYNVSDRNPNHMDWLFGQFSLLGAVYGNNQLVLGGAASLTPVDSVMIRMINAPQSGTIWKYVNDYETYRCPSLTTSKPQSLVGSNGRYDYAAFSQFSGASLRAIRAISYCVTDPGIDLAPNAPTAQNWTGAVSGVYPSQFFNNPHWPRVTAMPTPLICQEDPAHNIQANLEGQHASSDQMAHMHFGGSYYGSPDGSVTFYIENDNNSIMDCTYGTYLWLSQAPSGRLFSLSGDPGGSSWGGWDSQ